MKRLSLTLLISLLISVNIVMADDFRGLWKDIEEKRAKDLPATQIELLDKVIAKAEREKSYGNLMKAVKERMETRYIISPDSFEVDLKKLETITAKTSRSSIVYAVYNSILGSIYRDKASRCYDDKTDRDRFTARANDFFIKSLSDPQITAGVTTKELYPFFSKKEGTSLLVSLAYNADMYEKARDYFVKKGDRPNALIMSLEALRNKNTENKNYLHQLDSLIAIYGDIEECCLVATAKYRYLNEKTKVSNEEKIKFVRESLKRWGSFEGSAELKDAEHLLTRPSFEVTLPKLQIGEDEELTVYLKDVRNICNIKTTIWKTDLTTGAIAKRDYDGGINDDFYRSIINGRHKSRIMTISNSFDAPDYVFSKKEFVIPSLKKGIYIIETSSDQKDMEAVYNILYVSNLYVMSESLPMKNTRIAVVNLKSGQPVANTPVTIYYQKSYSDYYTKEVTTDINGEVILKHGDRAVSAFANTSTDKYMPATRISESFGFYNNTENRSHTAIFTDRAVYRPGQTVKVAVVAYRNLMGRDIKADSAANINITLKDTNYKVIAQKTVTTDAYGKASTEFVLPSKTLNGTFSITDSRSGYTSIRVEEYKRPTFEVRFNDPEIQYHLGDTVKVKATAMSFAGVAIQNAKVKYEIRRFLYWYPYLSSRNSIVITSGNTVTSEDGSFSVDVPLTSNADMNGVCYNFIVDAYVTDTAGETRSGRLSLPASEKKVWIECNMPEKIESSEKGTIRFNVRNIARKDIDTDVTFYIDNNKGYMVKANSDVDLNKIIGGINSGRHKLTITAMGEKIEHDFILFSLNDKVPAYNTDEWFYITSDTFPTDGSSVSMQIGSSLNDVHALYTVISGNKIIKMGAFSLDNEVKTFNLNYKDEYGDGILITYAWVKNGHLYTRNAEIKKALPKKELDIKWTTFRNRLVPGQKEQWTLHVSRNDKKTAEASVIATMYDMSLDNIIHHGWSRIYGLARYIPFTRWTGTESNSSQYSFMQADVKWEYSKDNIYELFPPFNFNEYHLHLRGTDAMGMPEYNVTRQNAVLKSKSFGSFVAAEEKIAETEDTEETVTSDNPQLRENLNETAFFYPSLTTDSEGDVNISFTLPESITTWKFMAFANDKEMSNEVFTDEIVASKKVMLQPNMPRFIRHGDKTVISARIMNISENDIRGKAVMQICDAETEKVILERHSDFSTAKGKTSAVTFNFDAEIEPGIVICRMFAEGKDFSDGEQHYINILTDKEIVTTTKVSDITEAGTHKLNTDDLFGKDVSDKRVTIEFTENPQWFVIQALPSIAETNKDDAISTATKIYANIMARSIANASPAIKNVINGWNKNEDGTALISNLYRNEELKDMVLEETPWIAEAESETEMMRKLKDLFDNNTMDSRINDAVQKLSSLQLADGSWGWWRGMKGNKYITMTVAEMLVRLETMTESNGILKGITDKAMNYLSEEIRRELMNKKNSDLHRLSPTDIRYLYIKSLRGEKADKNDKTLLKMLGEHKMSDMNIYEKSMAAVIFYNMGIKEKAIQAVNSIKEYTVYNKAMGRYYDSETAEYSWFDYKIPTQVMAIEALKQVSPKDSDTIEEMKQWLLQEKRTTSWDTPINAVNAIYAFTNGGSDVKTVHNDAVININGKSVSSSTAGTGYIKTSAEGNRFDISISKKTNGTSWLSMYGTYTSDVKDIDDASTGISIKREIITDNTLTVGSKIKVRLTIVTDRDYDFVQVTDKRAACMEPVNQISGYNGRYYCSMKDNAAYYYFDMMPKGRHIIETEYYIDRQGSYTTGTCKIQCAYAPAFSARTKANIITVK